MGDVTFGKTEPRAVPRSGLWGQTPLFSSLCFLEGKKGGSRAAPRGAERTPQLPRGGGQGAVRGMLAVGVGSARGSEERRPAPLWGASSAPPRQSQGEVGAHGAAGAGHPGPPWGGRSTPPPFGTPGGSAVGNGPADPAPRPDGEARLGVAAIAANANETPLPSPLLPGRSLDGGHHGRQPPAGRGPPGFALGAPGGAAATPELPGTVPPSGRTRSPVPPWAPSVVQPPPLPARQPAANFKGLMVPPAVPCFFPPGTGLAPR